MTKILKPAVPAVVTFYSASFSFQLQLKFHSSGGLDGIIRYEWLDLVYEKEFTGVQIPDETGFRLSFVVNWEDKNLDYITTTCFTGYLATSENINCLALRWLQSQSALTQFGAFTSDDLEIMFDVPGKPPDEVIKMMIEKIPDNAFD